MALVTLDFDLNKEAAGLPESTYKFQAEEANLTESQAGNAMIKVKWVVVEDPQYNGRVVFDNVVLVASMARRIKSLGQAMGLDFSQGVDPELLQGRTVWAETVNEEYMGESNAKIKKYKVGR